MPELPEVETTRRGIAPYVVGQTVEQLVLRRRDLRWPVSAALPRAVAGQQVDRLWRRAKYLIFETRAGNGILHLGMSGSLKVVASSAPLEPHDHYDLIMRDGAVIRYNDPRRFGALLWTRRDPLDHSLLSQLGPEPLGEEFHGEYLYRVSRGRRLAIKQHIMNGQIVVGVGNIYASEALFRSGIHPARAAGRVSANRMACLAAAIRQVLREAIEQGGTTLRDFTGHDGRPGYFQQELLAYGRAGQACVRCGGKIRATTQGQRSTYYCPNCQR